MKRAAVLLLLLSAVFPLFSGDTPHNQMPDGEYPKVALVLSGGAAYGFSHIGVIRTLEEAGIPIDLVVGVSMGGLVGALYAVGYSPGDMETLADETDWRSIFSDPVGVTPYLTHPVLPTRYNILSMHFDSRGIGSTLGILPDQQINAHLSRFVRKVSHIRDYDQFHIPLRITGTDLFTGQTRVFNHVPLHAAMRATMSIPGIFSPFYVDGGYYIDGGAVNNLPISLARDMGADIIISVQTTGELIDSIDSFSSSMSVVTQSALHALSNTLISELQYSDLHIDVRFPEGMVMEFWRYREIIYRGRSAAVSQWEEITALAEEIAQKRPLDFRDPDRTGYYHSLPRPRVTGVEVDPSLIVPDFPLELFRVIPAHDEAYRSRVETAAARLVASRSYESVGYSYRKDGDQLMLSLYPSVLTRGKHYLGATFLFDGSYDAGSSDPWDLRPGFSLDLVFTDLLQHRSLLTLNFQLTDRMHTDVSFSYPIGPLLYVRPFVSFGEKGLVVPEEKTVTAAVLDTGQEIGVQLRPYFRTGVSIHAVGTWSAEHGEDFPSGDYQLLITPSVDLQSYQPSRFPYSGMRLKGFLEIPLLQHPAFYRHFSMEFRHYVPLYLSGTLGYDISASSFRKKSPSTPILPWHLADIGGWDAVPGYVPGAKMFPDAVTAGARYYHRFSVLSGILGMNIFASAQVRCGFGWESLYKQPEEAQFIGGAGAGIGIDSILGEMVIGAGFSFKGNIAFYLLLN